MKTFRISDFTGGWFLGNFSPSLLANDKFEVAVKWFKSGDVEPDHYQVVAFEYTVIIAGSCRIGDRLFGEGEIVQIDPGEVAGFEALSDGVLVAVKTPSIPQDKRLA